MSLSNPSILAVPGAGAGAAAADYDAVVLQPAVYPSSALTAASALAANSFLYTEWGGASWSGFPSLYMFLAS